MNEELPDQNHLSEETKQARREKQRVKKRAKIPQHGKSLARVYRDAVSKRAGITKTDKQSS